MDQFPGVFEHSLPRHLPLREVIEYFNRAIERKQEAAKQGAIIKECPFIYQRLEIIKSGSSRKP